MRRAKTQISQAGMRRLQSLDLAALDERDTGRIPLGAHFRDSVGLHTRLRPS